MMCGCSRHSFVIMEQTSCSGRNASSISTALCSMCVWSRSATTRCLHRRSKQRVVADRDQTHIEHHAVEIEEAFLPEQDVCSIITKEWRLHPHIITTLSKQPRQNLPPLLLLTL